MKNLNALKKLFLLLIVVACSKFSFAQTTINPDTVCAGATGEIYFVNNTQGSTYNWTITGGGGVLQTGQGTNSVTVNWGTTPGLYPQAVSVIETSADGCVGTPVTLDVQIIEATLLAIGPFCEGDQSVALTGTPAGGTYSGNGVSNGNFDPSLAGVGTHTITYNVAGCSTTIDVIVSPIPVTGPIQHN